MSRHVLGIDPGKTGALALLAPSGTLIVQDVPTLKIGTKTVVDHAALAGFFDMVAGQPITVFIEQVGTRPGEGAVGAFDFGRTYGMLIGLAAAHFMPIEFVTPAKWKAAMAVKGDKDVSRQRASQLMPRNAHLWPLKKHDGRAEAALIALYGQQQMSQVAA